MKTLTSRFLLIRFLCAVGAALLLAPVVCAQARIDGHWEGNFTAGNRTMRLSLDLAKNAQSQWIASMGTPDENIAGLFVRDVAVLDKSVEFVAVELMMAKFSLTLQPAGTLNGTVSGRAFPQGPLPIELKRTGEAKVELMPPVPAVSRELEGDWEGSVDTPAGQMTLTVRLKNQPDKTALATIAMRNDSPLPLSGVTQSGQKVEFAFRMAHITLRGNLNKEGTGIAGTLIHEENPAPFTLRKK